MKRMIAVVIGIAALAVAGYLLMGNKQLVINRTSPQEKATTNVTSLTSASSHILVGGDVFWGRQFERAVNNDPTLDYNFPFSGLSTLNKKDYDAWIANLECPVTDANIPFQTQWDAIAFNCRPEYLKAAAKWFDVLGQANNHSDNVELEAGLLETRENLQSVGIQYFGHYDSTLHEQLCEVISLPAQFTLSDGSTQEGALPIAFCGYHGVFRVFTEEDLAVISRYAKHFITFAFPHAGAEYQPVSDELRETAYRTMIDNGADVVYGNHPHWIQNTESYKGKLITYSLGNFIFDQQFNQDVTRSLMIDTNITIESADTDLMQLKTLAETCESFQDTCLIEAKRLNLLKPVFTIEHNALGTTTTDFVTTKASGSALDAILQRATWDTTKTQLQTKITP